MGHQIKGLLFDKDGTLFDFRASWAPIYAGIIAELSEGDLPRARRIAAAAGFDPATPRFAPGSPLIAGTTEEVTAVFAPFAPGLAPESLHAWLEARIGGVALAPVTDLAPLLEGLRGMGLRLGLATNDSESAARAHLAQAGAAAHFDFLAGYDSGHGPKPGPGMVTAFCAALGLAPESVAVIGDSLHDLVAARAAGSRAVAVLTGIARAADLAPHAEVVLPSIRDLPAWLERQ
ncbi:MAG TPA: HAD family hydrolase [Paracoccaceae bacterium]|nr:HAD family hydrolase [Paracoccaceae bacterium]